MKQRNWPKLNSTLGVQMDFEKWLKENLTEAELDRIAPKEPLRVEWYTDVPSTHGRATPSIEIIGLRDNRNGYYLHGFEGKKVRVIVEEIPDQVKELPAQCEHDYKYKGCGEYKCTKCGELK